MRIFTVVAAVLASTGLQPAVTAAESAPASTAQIDASHAALPVRFEPNVGQTDPSVRFLARGNGYTLFLTSSEAVIALGKAPSSASRAENPDEFATDVVRMRFGGANPQPRILGQLPLPGITNYFIGNDPDGWHTDIVSFGEVRYQQIYPGIDLVYYGSQRDVEYDFVVQPGADPAVIRLDIEGASSLRVSPSGELVLAVASGELRQKAPVIYQEGPAGMVLVAGGFVVKGKQVGFEVASYDRSLPLVIDPVLVYSTYLGGSGFDQANSLHVGPTGDAYVVGTTNSTDFPIAGTPPSTNNGGQDVFVTKLSLTGDSLIYATYIGGIGVDIGNDIVASGAGTAYLTGSTDSIDFPVVTPTIAAQVGGTDAFLTKLSAAGNALVYSTYWGSTGFEEGMAVAVDPADNAYIAGNTSAADFPTQTPFQAALAGGTDVFMTKFSVAGNSIVYSTFLGGVGDDVAFDMKVADDAAVFVVGSTNSANFPTTAGSAQPALSGGRDAFVTHFSLAGNALLYSTYLGGSGTDEAFGMAIDAPMNVYLTGRTNSSNFPSLGAVQPVNRGGANDAFVAKLNPAGSALVYSTYLGGAGDDKGEAIAVDGATNVFVTGSTSSANFPLLAPFQAILSGPSDAFVTKLDQTGAALVYSTYLGGTGADQGHGVGTDLVGNAYVAGYTQSPNFPTLIPFQVAFGGVRDAFVTKLAETTELDFLFADSFE